MRTDMEFLGVTPIQLSLGSKFPWGKGLRGSEKKEVTVAEFEGGKGGLRWVELVGQ